MPKAMIVEMPAGIRFKVRVQPRASRNEVIGWQGDALKIRLTAPPVEGEANQACRQFVADFLGVSPRRVQITRGLKSRTKTIEIADFSVAEFEKCWG